MRFSMLPQVFAQMFKKPWTNKFPAKYIPHSTTKFLDDVGSGKAKLISYKGWVLDQQFIG